MSKIEVIPLFPLPVVALPGEVIPLHIFEDRYKEMIELCLNEQGETDEVGWFGITYLNRDKPCEIGVAVYIRKVLRRYEDGRIDIVTVATRRFKVLQLIEGENFYRARVQYLDDDSSSVDAKLRNKAITLHEKMLEMVTDQYRPIQINESESVSFMLGSHSGMSDEQRQLLLEQFSESKRLEHLVKHYQRMIAGLMHREALKEQPKLKSYLH